MTVPQKGNTNSEHRFLPKGTYSPWEAGVIGGVINIVLIFIPFSPFVGGAISGYLLEFTPDPSMNSTRNFKSGTIAGLIVFLPLFAILLYLVLTIGRAGGPETWVKVTLEIIVGMGIIILYASGLSVLGSRIAYYYFRSD